MLTHRVPQLCGARPWPWWVLVSLTNSSWVLPSLLGILWTGLALSQGLTSHQSEGWPLLFSTCVVGWCPSVLSTLHENLFNPNLIDSRHLFVRNTVCWVLGRDIGTLSIFTLGELFSYKEERGYGCNGERERVRNAHKTQARHFMFFLLLETGKITNQDKLAAFVGPLEHQRNFLPVPWSFHRFGGDRASAYASKCLVSTTESLLCKISHFGKLTDAYLALSLMVSTSCHPCLNKGNSHL